MDAYLYQPLQGFALYEKLAPGDVCPAQVKCKIKFKSVDATELTAAEFEKLEAIKSKVPHNQFWAEYQLREHLAECSHRQVSRRGVIVKFSQGSLKFKREFLLTKKSK